MPGSVVKKLGFETAVRVIRHARYEAHGAAADTWRGCARGRGARRGGLRRAGVVGAAPPSAGARCSDSTLARTEVAAARIGDGAYVVGGFAAPSGATTDGRRALRPAPRPLDAREADPAGRQPRRRGRLPRRPLRRRRLHGDAGLAAETAALWRYRPATDRWTRLRDAPTRARRARRGRRRRPAVRRRRRAWRARRCARSRSTTSRAGAGRAGRRCASRASTSPAPCTAARSTSSPAGPRGAGNLAVAERYVPARRRWERLPAMRKPRGGIAAAVAERADRRRRRRGGRGDDRRGRVLRPAHAALALRAARCRRRATGSAPCRCGGRVFALEGGPTPGLSYSAATEALRIARLTRVWSRRGNANRRWRHGGRAAGRRAQADSSAMGAPRHGAAAPRGLGAVALSPLHEGRFGRMFRDPQPLDPGHRGDQRARQARQGVRARIPPATTPKIPSGYTYLGQFVDHDITFDPVSKLQRDNDPDALVDFRTPRFDLDCLYGSGPDDDPFMYEWSSPSNRGVKLLVGRNPNTGAFDLDDLPRNAQGRALIGDPRNDENIIVSQLQLLFIRFHNKVVDRTRQRQKLEGAELFAEAQRITRWHYQWIVVHDFLQRIVGRAMAESVLKPGAAGAPATTDLKFFKWTEPAVHAGRVLRRRLPLRALDGARGVRPQRHGAPGADLRRRRQARPARAPRRLPPPARAVDDRLAVLLQDVGGRARRSSAARSTRASPRRCTSCRRTSTPGATRCRSSTCAAVARSGCRPARTSRPRWASRR